MALCNAARVLFIFSYVDSYYFQYKYVPRNEHKTIIHNTLVTLLVRYTKLYQLL